MKQKNKSKKLSDKLLDTLLDLRVVRSFKLFNVKLSYQMLFDFLGVLGVVAIMFGFLFVSGTLIKEAKPAMNLLASQSELQLESLTASSLSDLASMNKEAIQQKLIVVKVLAVIVLFMLPLVFSFFKYLTWNSKEEQKFNLKRFFGFYGINITLFFFFIGLYLVSVNLLNQVVLSYYMVIVFFPMLILSFEMFYYSFYRISTLNQAKKLSKELKQIHKKWITKFPGFFGKFIAFKLSVLKQFALIASTGLKWIAKFYKYLPSLIMKFVVFIGCVVIISKVSEIPSSIIRLIINFIFLLLFIAWCRNYTHLVFEETVLSE